MTTSFVINQTTGPAQLIKQFFYVFATSARIRRALLTYIILIMILDVVLFFLLPPEPLETTLDFGVVVPLMLIGILFLMFVLLYSCIQYLSVPRNFQNITYRFNHWGMEKTGRGIEFSNPWRSIRKYKESKSFFLFYISLNDVHIIQKKAFKDEAEVNAFREFVKERLNK